MKHLKWHIVPHLLSCVRRLCSGDRSNPAQEAAPLPQMPWQLWVSPSVPQCKGWWWAWPRGGKAGRTAVPGHLQEQRRGRCQVEECCCLSLMPLHGLEKPVSPPVLPKIAGTCRQLLQKMCLECWWVLLLENLLHSFLTQNTFPLKFTQCVPTVSVF